MPRSNVGVNNHSSGSAFQISYDLRVELVDTYEARRQAKLLQGDFCQGPGAEPISLIMVNDYAVSEAGLFYRLLRSSQSLLKTVEIGRYRGTYGLMNRAMK